MFHSISKEKSNVALLKNLIAVFFYPLVSKFMRCLSKNKLQYNKTTKNPSNIEIKVPDME